MSTFDILHPGPWFGPRQDPLGVSGEPSASDEKTRLLDICRHLKTGDFSARSALEGYIRSCTEMALKCQAIRLYCYIARHEDIAFIGELLAKCGHDEVFAVVSYAPHTLSPQVVPYLFALFEEYDDTPIAESILSAIDRLFPFQYEGEEVDIEALGQHFAGFAKELDANAYYYEGVEAFAGNLTKDLIENAATARHQQVAFPLANTPTLLSIWSGEKCPVFYGDLVSDAGFEAVVNYVKSIAAMHWVRGEKYFYGHRIV